ncbi:MAG TPA: 4Fe-4S binding protein [Spirochaetota bacterium]|nr:4Fe-4S binding protein [Spirochaetota bacterium]
MYDYQKCIRCYCCMEICPEAAIGLKRGKLQWLLDLFG